jgi:hypothetical protein
VVTLVWKLQLRKQFAIMTTQLQLLQMYTLAKTLMESGLLAHSALELLQSRFVQLALQLHLETGVQSREALSW